MKLKVFFNNLYWRKKYSTLENKYETLLKSKIKAKEDLLELQNKYISLLEKVVNIDELQKQMKIKINELEMKGNK